MNAREFTKQRALIERRFTSKRARSKAMACLMRRAGADLVVVNGRLFGWKLKNGQTVCVKDRYANEHMANANMQLIQRCNKHGCKVPIRAYACAWCHGWHLTSQPPKHDS